jgi:hypothetical protein
VALKNYTNYNEGLNNYFYINGKYYSSAAIFSINYWQVIFLNSEYYADNQAVLEELYSLFAIDTSKTKSIIKDSNGKLINAGEILKKKIIREKDVQNANKCDQSVETFLRNRLKEIAADGTYAPGELVPMWSVTELLRAYLPDSFYMYVTSTPELLHGGGFTEIVNGTSELPNAIFRNITSNVANFFYETNSQVTEAKHINSRTYLTIKRQNEPMNSSNFDAVAFTMPARQVSLVNFEPRLDYAKKYALDSFH